MCSEGQVAHLYKYNGLSPRMFHTARHFHHLKLRRASADRLKSACDWMPHRHLTTSRPLMILVVKQMGGGGRQRGQHRERGREGMFINGRNEVFLPAGCSGCHMADWDISYRGHWTLQVGQTADTNANKYDIKPKSFGSSLLTRCTINSFSQKVSFWSIDRGFIYPSALSNQWHTLMPLSQQYLKIILTWLCVSMATMPTSVASFSPWFLSTYIITTTDYSTKTAEMSGENGFSRTLRPYVI